MAFGIPESAIEEIKARTDLSDLIAGYGIQVKRAGGSYKACCPFHHEKTPSFHIQPEKGFYHCFGCGESGDAIKFVMKYEGLTFIEAAQKLQRLRPENIGRASRISGVSPSDISVLLIYLSQGGKQ